MNSLRDIVDSSPELRSLQTRASNSDGPPQPLGPALWDWQQVKRVLVVRLRSIGDTVLATPSLIALKRFLPNASIDILVEDWVAPVLDAHPSVSKVITLERGSLAARARLAKQIRATRYDVVFNLHGGTTASILTRATGAPHRVGYCTYQYATLHNHLAPSPLDLWKQVKTHSVEQQLALIGWTGVPVTDRPSTQLAITREAANEVDRQIKSAGLTNQKIAVLHPTAAFATKQWATEKFAKVAEILSEKEFANVAIAGPTQKEVLTELSAKSSAPIVTLNLTLPEVSALTARAKLFVGNDSGIAHIAVAVGAPSVVIFGSSNVAHWRPWNRAPAEVVLEKMDCQPCHGYFCEKFDQPECILRVPVDRVIASVERVLSTNS